MRKTAVGIAVFLLLLTAYARFFGGPSFSSASEYVPGQLLVMTRGLVSGERFANMNASCGTRIERLIATFDKKQIHLLVVVDRRSVEDAIRCWGQLPEVESAEPNYIIKIQPKK